MVAVIKSHYDLDVREYTPDETDVAQYIAEHGKHAFYESVELRKACCHMRKVKPLQRALAGQKSWLTGQRAEQSITRAALPLRELDTANGLEKFNPLRDWTFADVKGYIAQFNVPYNPLHDQGYPSIGCEPCTRAIKPNEDIRAGRWWWENQDNKECGLHSNTRISNPSTPLHEDKND
jgi:phosphoadenosine phosphosulfate reductase